MPLNLNGFVTPADQFQGLYQMSNHLEKNRLRQEEQERQQKAQTTASAKFLTDYLDPKDHLTGSPYDPEVVRGFQDALSEGMKLAKDGADTPTLMMALAPKVNRLAQYSQKAKYLTARAGEFEKQISSLKGIDRQKAVAAFKQRAFYDGGKLKDISQIDPDKDYGDEVLRNDDVYTPEGVDEWLKGLKQNKTVSDVRLYDGKGNLRRTKAEMSAPGGFVPETDARGAHTGFVPDYDVATDDGNPILHDFHTDKGNVKAPVRMVKDDFWNTLSTPAKAYFLQETRKYAKEHGQEVSSPQAYNFAKAIAYDHLKASGKYATTISELTDNKPSAQQVRINLTGSPYALRGGGRGGNADGDVNVNDVYGDIEHAVSGAKEGNGFPLSELPDQASNAVMGMVRNKLGNTATIGDAYLKNEGGNIVLKTANGSFGIPEGTVIGNLTKTGVNLKSQVGAKEKRAVVAAGAAAPKKETKKFKGVPSGGF